MNDARTTKYWKVTETMLLQASEFLNNPVVFKLKEQEFAEYRFNSRERELREAMRELEKMAKSIGAKSGFWRRIKKVAEHLGDTERANEYEEKFHKAIN